MLALAEAPPKVSGHLLEYAVQLIGCAVNRLARLQSPRFRRCTVGMVALGPNHMAINLEPKQLAAAERGGLIIQG